MGLNIQSEDKSIRPLQFQVALFMINDWIANFTDTAHSSRYIYEGYLVSSTCRLGNLGVSNQFTDLAH